MTRKVSATTPAQDSSNGSLGRLWEEFNDPGPAGDAVVFLKKYSDGILPGCMGLVFLTVGIGVMILFFQLASTSDKRSYWAVLFGAVFALAGFGVLRLGIHTVIRKSGGRRDGSQ